MKYLVMECHAGYAVLMDESAQVVRAANLHYKVGQTVTDPVLMHEDAQKQIRMTQKPAFRITAAAACLLVMSAAGFGLYRSSRTRSVVLVVEKTRYELKLNRSGEVMSVQSNGTSPEALDASLEGQTPASVINALLQDSLSQGTINDGDTVQIYLAADDAQSYDVYKTEIETEAAKLSLNADVQGIEAADTHPVPPDPKAEDGIKPDPEKDGKKDPAKDTPPGPDGKTDPLHGKDGQEPTPPVPPAEDDKPVPPAPDQEHADPAIEPEPPVPPAEQPADIDPLHPKENDDAPHPKKDDADKPKPEPPHPHLPDAQQPEAPVPSAEAAEAPLPAADAPEDILPPTPSALR